MMLWKRLQYLLPWRRRAAESDMQEELRSIAEMARPGELGNLTLAAEDARAAWGWTRIEQTVQDLRYALRTLWRAKVFAAAAILSLAIGLGANIAMFAVVRAVVLRPLPFPDAERLVVVGTTATNLFSAPSYMTLREQNRTLELLGAYETSPFVLSGDAPAVQLEGQRISYELVAMLGLNRGLQPVVGRIFSAGDFDAADPPVVLISDRLWRRRFNGDEGILGRSLTLDGQACTVIGILSPRFTLFPDADLLLPLSFTPAQLADTWYRKLELLGRLKLNLSLSASERQLSEATRTLTRQTPAPDARLYPLRDRLVAHMDRTLFTLWGVAGLVFLIACFNFSNLLLARSVSRRREVALRAALGARPMRLIRLVVTEGVVLSLAAGVIGVLLAYGAMSALAVLGPKVVPRLAEIELNAWVVGFAAVLALASGFVFGGVPTITLAYPRLTSFLNDPDGTSSAGSSLFRHHRGKGVLTLTQIAATLVLLIGASLLAKSFWQLARLAPGYEPSRLLALQFELPAAKYGSDGRTVQFANDLTEKLKALPGVQHVSATTSLPLLPSQLTFRYVAIEGRTDTGPLAADDMPLGYRPPPPPPPPPAGRVTRQEGPRPPTFLAFQAQVGSEFLETMAIPLLKGRTFTAQDDERAPAVALINDTMARRLWPDSSPLGHRIRARPAEPLAEIVGVTGDIRRFARDDSVRPEFYLPLAQRQAPLGPDRPLSAQMRSATRLSFAVRTVGGLELMADTLRREVAVIDPDLPIVRLSPMQGILNDAAASRRFVLISFAVFAGMALVLAAVGVYGLMSYLVGQRTREFGVRIALGAGRGHVLLMALADGLKLAIVGVFVGLGIAVAASEVLRAWLYKVPPTDPPTYAALALTMAAVITVASYLPARRATRVDPMTTLRQG